MSKKKISKKRIKEEVIGPIPPVEPGYANILLLREDLVTLMNLMNVSVKTYDELAVQAAKQGDKSSYDVFLARCKLSRHYALTLAQFLKMPEPESREVH